MEQTRFAKIYYISPLSHLWLHSAFVKITKLSTKDWFKRLIKTSKWILFILTHFPIAGQFLGIHFLPLQFIPSSFLCDSYYPSYPLSFSQKHWITSEINILFSWALCPNCSSLTSVRPQQCNTWHPTNLSPVCSYSQPSISPNVMMGDEENNEKQ